MGLSPERKEQKPEIYRDEERRCFFSTPFPSKACCREVLLGSFAGRGGAKGPQEEGGEEDPKKSETRGGGHFQNFTVEGLLLRGPCGQRRGKESPEQEPKQIAK